MEHKDSGWETLDQLLAMFKGAVDLSGTAKLSIFISTDAIRAHIVPLRICLN